MNILFQVEWVKKVVGCGHVSCGMWREGSSGKLLLHHVYGLQYQYLYWGREGGKEVGRERGREGRR